MRHWRLQLLVQWGSTYTREQARTCTQVGRLLGSLGGGRGQRESSYIGVGPCSSQSVRDSSACPSAVVPTDEPDGHCEALRALCLHA